MRYEECIPTSAEARTLENQLIKLADEVLALQNEGKRPKGGPLRKDRRRGRQDMKVRPDRDQRAHSAWYKFRPSDRRWLVYHRCQFTGKVGVPLKMGRGRRGKALAMLTVRMMQASGEQIATLIRDGLVY